MKEHLPPSKRLYNYINHSDTLMWISLESQQISSTQLIRPLKAGCCWVELPDASLFVTGGFFIGSTYSEVWKVDSQREFSMIQQPSMLTKRFSHASVYFQGFVYALGGDTSKCERYNCEEGSWEELPCYQESIMWHSAIALEKTQAIYIVGTKSNFLSFFSVEKLQWFIMSINLPKPFTMIPCFNLPSTPDKFCMISNLNVYLVDIPEMKSYNIARVDKKRMKYRSNAWYYEGKVFLCKIESSFD
eukprot:CAMPEP_0204897824 /NCGR_PEP_ID=MMETSP1397-20131031/946_1 /ASSEMBLY_ACC=CAM_ASM_000891 /TAXON_ID=49980 /ORGANISM="Climacostomum Climacostomum virens, Strain Stock W-24" /LENGTH=244 /DNA_ID=CAMNT_0052065601 /DNA_START=837 /DNA_END=1568 /DNA_ORIENTATION=-